MEPQGQFDRVREAFENKDYESCRDELTRLGELAAAQSEIHRWFARLEYRQGNWSSVREHTTARLQAMPRDEEMLRLKARACARLRIWKDCVQVWSDLAKIRPEWPEAWYQLARSAQRAGKAEQAAAAAARLVELADNDPAAAQLAIRYHLECEHLGEAAVQFLALAKTDMDRAREELREIERANNSRSKAVALSALSQFESSEALAANVSSLSEELIGRAIAAERKGQDTDALLDYAATVLLLPDDALANRGCARCLEKLYARARERTKEQNLAAAIDVYDTILKAAPLQHRAALARAKAFTHLRNWSAAREAWKALCRGNGDTQTWIQYARAAGRSERFQEAGQAWKTVQQFDPATQEAATALARLPGEMVKAGRAAFVEGRWIEACEFLSAVPLDVPAKAEAERRLEQLARHLRKRIREAYKQRNYAEIAGQGSIALALLSNDGDVLSIVGRAAKHVQQSALAAQAWRALMEVRPDDVPVQLALAESCVGMGALDEAERLLSGVLRQDPSNEKAGVLQVRLREARSTEAETRHIGRTAERRHA